MWDEYLKSNWRDEPPVYISQELQDLIKDHPDFSTTPIGPVGNCMVSEQLRNIIPESLATSYIVNCHKDTVMLWNLISSKKEAQPPIITYSFPSEMYSHICSDKGFMTNSNSMATLKMENPTIANVLIDHFGLQNLLTSTSYGDTYDCMCVL